MGSLFISSEWLIESKAFSRSKKILPTITLLFKAFKMSCVNLNIASSLEKLFLKPNCCAFSKLLFKYSINLLYKTFSNTFENEVSIDIGL